MKVTCTYHNVNAFMMYDTLVMEFLYRQVSCCGHTQRLGELCHVSVPMVTSCSVPRMTDSSDVTTKQYVLVPRSY